MKKVLFLTTALLASLTFKAQVTVNNTSMSIEQYVQNVLAGSGVTIFNVQYNGSMAAAQVSNEQVGSFNDVNSAVGLASGVIMGSGNVTMAQQLNTGGGSSLGGTNTQGVDTDLAGITSSQIWDEAVIEFDFVPQGDTISFNYVFASEEYEEYVCGTVNDAFGFFLTGNNPLGGTYNAQNIALVPDPSNPGSYTTTPVSINTVNPGVAGTSGTLTNCTSIDPNFASYNVFYTQNTTNAYEYDGRTVVLQARAYVNCGDTLHIKLAIGDGGDAAFDSGVFLEAGSFKSEVVLVDITSATGDSTVIEGCADADIKFTRPDTVGTHTVHFTIGGTAINGVDYSQIADSVTFAAGVDTAILHITPFADGIAEGQENISISVSTINACGDTIITTGNIYILDVPNMTTVAPDHSPTCPSPTLPVYVQVAGAMAPYTYVWTDSGGNPLGTNNDTLIVSGMATDTFYVSTTDSCNLVTINDTIIVTINGTLPILQTSNDTTLNCPNHIINLSASASSGIPPYNFFWTPGGAGASVNVIPTQTTTYYITTSDGCGNTTTDSVTATVNYTPVGLSLPNDTVLTCPNLTHNIPVEAIPTNGFGPFLYDWGSTSTDTTSFVNVSVNTDQSVYAMVTDFCGFTATDTMDISFIPYTPLSITLLPVDSTCANENVSLLATALDGISPYSFSWSDGNTGNAPLFSSSIIGDNNITVTVTDECSLQETADMVINIMSCAVVVSNVFTPNGDGINDLFSIKGIEYFPNNHLTVLNRWGRKVFDADTYQNDWDGKDLSAGVYFYTLELNNSDNTIHKGAITLLK